MLSKVSVIIDVDSLVRCEMHAAHEQVAQMLFILPKKFDERKVSLKITDEVGALRLDKLQKAMLEHRSAMLFDEV